MFYSHAAQWLLFQVTMQLCGLCLLSTYFHQILAIRFGPGSAVWCRECLCHLKAMDDRPNRNRLDLQFGKAVESAYCEKGNLLRASLGHYSKPREALFINSLFGANCTRDESWNDIKQQICLCRGVLIQYVEFLEILTILCLSLLWYLLKRFWNTFVIICLAHGSRTVSYWLSYSPMGVCVTWFFWRDTKEESSSLSCARQSAGSLTKQSETSCFISTICMAFHPQFDKGRMVVCKNHGAEISDFPLFL